MDFTGTDWCSWCIKLHDEVFAHAEFLTYATEKYILVALDFPRGDEAKARVPNPERNDELMKQYSVSGFPTILLMTADGDVYGRTGYQAGGPETYNEHLTQIRDEGRAALSAAIKLVAEFEAAEGDARHTAVLKILAVLEGLSPESPVASRLAGPARAAIEMDPENASGLKLRAIKALLKAGHGDADLNKMAMELDPKNAEGLLELVVFAEFSNVRSEADLAACCDSLDKLIAAGNFNAEDKAIFMIANAAIWNAEYLDDMERAKAYATRALEFEIPDQELIARLKEMLNE